MTRAPTGGPAVTPPQRFYYGRVIAATSFAATFASVVFFNPVLGVFSSSLEEQFGWTRADVALAITLGSAGAGIASPAIGWAIDRSGGGRVIALSALVMGGCLLALARMDALWQLLVFYALGRALAVGALAPAAFIAVANWYVRRRAFVTGIVAVGSRLGMATLPVLVAIVIATTGSWRAGWVALALVIFTLGVAPPLLFMRRRPRRTSVWVRRSARGRTG
ncbi:MAG: MFS transporter [Dehalococcoidia bacterium]